MTTSTSTSKMSSSNENERDFCFEELSDKKLSPFYIFWKTIEQREINSYGTDSARKPLSVYNPTTGESCNCSEFTYSDAYKKMFHFSINRVFFGELLDKKLSSEEIFWIIVDKKMSSDKKKLLSETFSTIYETDAAEWSDFLESFFYRGYQNMLDSSISLAFTTFLSDCGYGDDSDGFGERVGFLMDGDCKFRLTKKILWNHLLDYLVLLKSNKQECKWFCDAMKSLTSNLKTIIKRISKIDEEIVIDSKDQKLWNKMMIVD